MSRTVKTFFAALIGATLAWSAAHADPVRLKFAVFTPPQEPTFPNVMKVFADEATKDSNGTLVIETFPGGALGKDPGAQVKLVQDGVADLAWIIPSYTPGRFPQVEAFELPGLFRTASEAAMTMWHLVDKGKITDFQDFVVIGMHASNPYFIHTKEPVKTLGDLKGLKIRAGGPAFGESLKALGAIPVGMPAPSVAESLSRGVMDGVAFEFNGHYAFRTADVAKYTMVGPKGAGFLGTAPMGTIMNKKKFESLPKAAQEAINKHRGAEQAELYAKLHDKLTRDLLARTRSSSDHVVTELTEADMQTLEKTFEPVIAAWAKSHERGAEIISDIRAEVAAMRAKN